MYSLDALHDRIESGQIHIRRTCGYRIDSERPVGKREDEDQERRVREHRRRIRREGR